MQGLNRNLVYKTPYELHKQLINHYVLSKKGSTTILKRDTSRDKRDIDVIRENHKFVWEEEDQPLTWEEKLAKKYYDKLFKEYCISDLSRYKENKFAMRWQTEVEMIAGKGQFVCGAKSCTCKEGLRSWEVNFAYVEHGQKRNALVKLRLCQPCSNKLNYHHKRKEVKRIKKRGKRRSSPCVDQRDSYHLQLPPPPGSPEEEVKPQLRSDQEPNSSSTDDDNNLWKVPIEEQEEPTREEEFEKYLEELLL